MEILKYDSIFLLRRGPIAMNQEKFDFTQPPTLTLEPFEEETTSLLSDQEDPAENLLSESEKQMIADFAAKIDLTNSNMILQYGAAAQKKIAGFSENALNNVRTKDLGEIGNMLTTLVNELKGFNADEEEKGLLGFFKKSGSKLSSLKTKYNKAESNVAKIVDVLEAHQVQLLKDVAMLDKLYQLNLNYFKELSMYILAGQQKLAAVRANELSALSQKALTSNLPEDAQAANDLATLCDRFEKKLHDLTLTRMISVQMAPQIRLVQNNDTIMAEKIQSALVNTIPLWKSQMVLALGLAHSQQAIEAQQSVDDVTNALLKKNADALKMATIETAKAAEKGIVDISTIKYTNDALISTLDEVVKIQEEGRAKRQQAEIELGRLEDQLKSTLLQNRK